METNQEIVAKTTRTRHVCVLPIPAQGHITPILQFSKRLASKGLKVTFLPVSADGFTDWKPGPGTVDIFPLSDTPQEANTILNTVWHPKTFESVMSQKLAQALVKIDDLSCLVYDAHMPWALDMARELGVLGAAFFTQTCSVSAIYSYIYEGKLRLPLEGLCGNLKLPGLIPLEIHDLPSFVSDSESYPGLLDYLVFQFLNVEKSDWIFFNTFYTLEEEVLKWMETKWSIKPIGPTIPSMYMDKRLEDDKDYGFSLFKPNSDTCMKWLDSKQPNSVIYVSFGSLASLGEDQMAQLAWGLKQTKFPFLWVVREIEENKLPHNFKQEIITSEIGLIVRWSPQLEVLAHKSIGCFVTHCGWNSTLEALSLGVPMVAMPQWTDQPTNAKYVSDDWEVGVRVKVDENGIVTKGEIEKCIKEVMEGERGKVLRKNSEKWKELANEAVGEGGSSDLNIQEFVTSLECNSVINGATKKPITTSNNIDT